MKYFFIVLLATAFIVGATVRHGADAKLMSYCANPDTQTLSEC